MKNQSRVVLTLLFCLGAAPCFAYQVWMGTHLMQDSVAENLEDWWQTANQLDGVNINRAPHDTFPASNADWQTILGQFSNVRNTMTEIARSEVSRNPLTVDEAAFAAIGAELEQKFQGARNYNYEIDHMMIYDERGSYQGTEYLYSWTEIEAQYMRSWLDTNGHQDVSLIWNARNNSQANRNWSASPLIDHVLIEASADALLNNTNNQVTLLNWLWTDPATANKDVILQIPRSNNAMTQYAATRRVAVMLGEELGYENGLQSDRLVLLPVTYNDNVDYLPETTSNGSAYANSITSLALSLIEQRPLFEGRIGTATNADADSFERILPVLSGDLMAGWDTWASSGVKAPDVTDGFTAGTTSKGGFSLDFDHRGSTDGTWGNLSVPMADPTATDDTHAVRLTNGSSGYYDFTLTDTGGAARDLIGFHFDAATLRPDSARDYELSVLSGDLTLGTVATGTVPSFSGGVQDWSNFDIDLTSLADRTLDANGTVTFRLEFTGGIPGAGGHHQGLDNVAITAAPRVLPPGDYSTLVASWETWSEVSADTWDATQTTGVMAQAVGTPESGGVFFNFSNATVENGASSDGQYGAEGPTGADTSVTLATDGVTLSNGFDGFIDFTLADTTGIATDLTGFHFDIGAFRSDAATNWELEILAGGALTAGSLATGVATVNLGPIQDDETINLTGLADSTLDANGSVTFRLSFTGGGGDSGAPASGHHLFLDNVGITGLPIGLAGDFNGDGMVNLADYTVWRDYLGADESVLPAGTGDGSGTVDEGDYSTWRMNFGSSGAASLNASNTPAPEPATVGLVLLACAIVSTRYRAT